MGLLDSSVHSNSHFRDLTAASEQAELIVRCSVWRPWVTVTSRDLLTLEDGEFLNDSVVRPDHAEPHHMLFSFLFYNVHRPPRHSHGEH